MLKFALPSFVELSVARIKAIGYIYRLLLQSWNNENQSRFNINNSKLSCDLATTMAPEPFIPVSPPGQERQYPDPDKKGKIPFRDADRGIDGETVYWIWGDLSSNEIPPIVLHGGPGMPHTYMLPISLISQDYGIPVVMYDQIGSGDSTRFKEQKGNTDFWTPELFIDELEHVIAQLGIKQFHLLGHSWGAFLAALYAIRRQPAGLRKLIISHCSTNLSRMAKTTARLRKQMPVEVQEAMNLCEREDSFNSEQGMQAMMYVYTLYGCRIQPWPAELTDTFAALREDDTVYSTMAGSSAFAMTGSLSTMPGLVEDRLEELTTETVPGGLLVLSSQHDVCEDDSMAGWFTRPTCKVKWVRFGLSSHFVTLEETEAFVKAVGLFLADA